MKCALCQDKICLRGEVCKKLKGLNSKNENIEHYLNTQSDKKILEASSQISKNIPRLEEIVNYIQFMNIKKIGIAFCKGLQNESKLIHKYLNSKNIDSYSVICGHASIDKG